MRRARTLALHLLAAAGCAQTPSQLVVLVDTDYRVPDELSAVEARVLDPDGAEVSTTMFAVAAAGAADPPTRFALPVSFGVVPLGGDVDRRVVVEITGMSPADGALVTRRARTGFLEGQSLLLPMFLLRRCANVRCDPGQTCTEDGCVDEETDPEDLPPVRPGDELDGAVARPDGSVEREDAGPRDAGPIDVDAGPPEMDAGPIGVDAGPPTDAGDVDAGPPTGNPPSYGGRIDAVTCGTGSTTLNVSSPVPPGATIVLSLTYRWTSHRAATATDSAGHTYTELFTEPGLDPRLNVLVASATSGLSAGQTIDVGYVSDARGLAIVADWFMDADPGRISYSNRALTNPLPSETLMLAGAGLVYAIVGYMDSGVLTPDPGWTMSSELHTNCGGAPGFMGAYTFYRSVAPGMTSFSGMLPSSRRWTVSLIAME